MQSKILKDLWKSDNSTALTRIITVWDQISYQGNSPLVFLERSMNAKYYTRMFKKQFSYLLCFEYLCVMLSRRLGQLPCLIMDSHYLRHEIQVTSLLCQFFKWFLDRKSFLNHKLFYFTFTSVLIFKWYFIKKKKLPSCI